MSLDAVGIISKDLERSVAFYGLLGVDVRKVADDHYEGETSSGVRLMLDSVELIKKLNPSWKEPAGCPVVLCFKQETPQEVDKIFMDITAAGFTTVKDPFDAFWGQRYASVMGPDGNQVDIFTQL